MLFFIFTVLTTKKYIFICINLITFGHRPTRYFQTALCRIKAKSSKNCLKMLSDQKRQKTSGHYKLKFRSFIDLMSFLRLVILIQVVHLGVLNIGLPLEIMFVVCCVFFLFLFCTFSFPFFQDGDYHHEMNSAHFLEWFEDSLLPTLKEPIVIKIDNTSYHNTRVEGTAAPRSNNTKPQVQEWLTTNGINRDCGMLKVSNNVVV